MLRSWFRGGSRRRLCLRSRTGSRPCLGRGSGRLRGRFRFGPGLRCRTPLRHWFGFWPRLGSGLGLWHWLGFRPCLRSRWLVWLRVGLRSWPCWLGSGFRLSFGFGFRLSFGFGSGPGFRLSFGFGSGPGHRRLWLAGGRMILRSIRRRSRTIFHSRTRLIVWFRARRSMHHWGRLDAPIRRESLGSNKLRRLAVVDRSKLRLVARRSLGQLYLRLHRRRVRRAECCNLRRNWTNLSPMRTTVVADPVDGSVVDGGGVDHCPVIDIGDMDVGVVDVVDGPVVLEIIPVPVAALVSAADVAEAIINTAIEADIPAPIAMVEAIPATVEAPISWGP